VIHPEQVVLRAVGPSLLPVDDDADSWRTMLERAVDEHQPKALLGRRDDLELFVFDCTDEGIARCAGWAARVWLMHPDRSPIDVWSCGAFGARYRCTLPYDHPGDHAAIVDGEQVDAWPVSS
jgi:hypothetical protein